MTHLRTFLRDRRGSLSVEAVFAFPILALGYLAFFALFDAYRMQNLHQRAAYTVTDLLTRQTGVDADYIDSVKGIYEIITQSREGADLRVSVLRWNPIDEEFLLIWSHATGSGQPLTQATLFQIEDRLPPIAPSDNAIVVESRAGFVPIFNIGLQPMDLENFVVSRPRFAPQLAWLG